MGAANQPIFWPRPAGVRTVSVGSGYVRDEEVPPKRPEPTPPRRSIFGITGWLVIAVLLVWGAVIYTNDANQPTIAAVAVAKSLDDHPDQWVRDRYFDGTLTRTANGQTVAIYGYDSQSTRVSLGSTKLDGFDPYARGFVRGFPTASQSMVWKAKSRWNKRMAAIQAAGRNDLDRETVDALK